MNTLRLIVTLVVVTAICAGSARVLIAAEKPNIMPGQ